MTIFSEEERNRHNAFIDSFREETDRGAVVIGGAFLENLLTEMLSTLYTRSTFVNGRGVKKEHEHEGFANNFAAKASLAFALGLISERDKEDIKLVRELRNKFAHDLTYTSFATPSVKAVCLKLAVVKDIDDSGFSASENFNTPRKQFLWTIAVLHMRLVETTGRTKKLEVPYSRRTEFVLEEQPSYEVIHMQDTVAKFGPDDEVIFLSSNENTR